jgi:hypothetical protein
MTKKRYCKTCQIPIEEGKEIKVKKGRNYRYSRYSSYPQDYVIYYLCSVCYQKQQEEIHAERKKTLRLVGLSVFWSFIILILAIILFFLYHRRQDKKID